MAADLLIRIVTDTSKAMGLDDTAAKTGKFAGAMKKAALPAAAVGVALVAVGKKAVDAASNLQQANGAVEAVFGDQAAAVKKYASTADTQMGLSSAAYQNYAALVGTSLQSAGMSSKQAAEESNKIMQRSADLSALYGGTTSDAVDAINAAVSRSEFDPLEKYGVSLSATKVQAILAAKGQDKLTGSALETAKKQAILAEIYKGTSKAAGQYAREADSVAGKQQTANAQWENAAAALGTALLPLVATLTGYLSQLAGWAQKNATTVQILAGVLLGMAVAILAVNAAFKIYAAATKVAAAVTWLMNSALLASPITWVVIAVIALVVAMVLLYKRSATVRNAINAMWAAIKNGAVAAWRWVSRAFSGIVSAARSAIAWIRANWKLLLAILTGPVGLAVLAIAKHWGKIKTGASDAVAYVRTRFSGLAATLSAPFNTAKTAAGKVVTEIGKIVDKAGAVASKFGTIKWPSGIKSAIDGVATAISGLVSWLGRIKWPSVPSGLTKILGKAGLMSVPVPAAALAGAGAPTVAGLSAPALRSSSVGGGVVINITGAVDPEGTARAVRRVLEGHARRVASA